MSLWRPKRVQVLEELRIGERSHFDWYSLFVLAERPTTISTISTKKKRARLGGRAYICPEDRGVLAVVCYNDESHGGFCEDLLT